jgi:hypothetical protein
LFGAAVSTHAGAPLKYAVQVSTDGNGLVASLPSGINCPGGCLAYYAQAATITLSATPAPGESFLGWGGACTGSGSTCVIPSIRSNASVTAAFTSDHSGEGGAVVPAGTQANAMLYWNGTAWAELLPPAESSGTFMLQLVDGGLQWTNVPRTRTFDVPGTARPWDQIVNSTMVFDGYASDYGTATAPITVALGDFGIKAGASIGLTCIGGVTNAGGLPNTDCRGLLAPFGPSNDAWQPACNSYYPSKYVDASEYPVNLFQLLGSFTSDAGVVIGKPFVITPSGRNVQVPAGATKMQVGFNECKYNDNSAAPLTFRLDY